MAPATEQADMPIDQEDLRYWIRRGPKSGAFLLVIPGVTLIGVGIGLLLGRTMPFSVVGVGAGLLVWGLIVSLTN